MHALLALLEQRAHAPARARRRAADGGVGLLHSSQRSVAASADQSRRLSAGHRSRPPSSWPMSSFAARRVEAARELAQLRQPGERLACLAQPILCQHHAVRLVPFRAAIEHAQP